MNKFLNKNLKLCRMVRRHQSAVRRGARPRPARAAAHDRRVSSLDLVRSSVIYGAIVVNNNHLDHAFAAVIAISDCYLCLGL